MKFAIQEKSEIDTEIVKEKIRVSRVHEYIECRLEDISEDMRKLVPIGDLNFVGKFLDMFHGVKKMNPIEVPELLRREEFLGRKYRIIPSEEIPKKGSYFVKNVSKLKEFSYCGNLEGVTFKEGIYCVSDIIDIRSEYRVFVSADRIVGIVNYNGDPEVFPNVETIRKMVYCYMMDRERPRSYTLDVAVTKNGRTVVLEVHPWACIGLYSTVWGSLLPYYYVDGYYYYIDVNKELRISK